MKTTWKMAGKEVSLSASIDHPDLNIIIYRRYLEKDIFRCTCCEMMLDMDLEGDIEKIKTDFLEVVKFKLRSMLSVVDNLD